MTKSKSTGLHSSGDRRTKATLGTSGNSAAVFQCQGFGDCRMVFTRSEHLARHIRKHTGERPFQCHCQKSFSRLDNLRQHCQTVHSDTPERNQELLGKLTALHTNLAASVAAQNRHAARAAAKRQTPNTSKPNRQKHDSDQTPASQEDCDMQPCQPEHGPGMTVNSLLSHEEAMESRYPTIVPLNRSQSPPMMSYTRPAPYTYSRRPTHYAYPTDMPPTHMAFSYPNSRAEYVQELSYQAKSTDPSWKYGKYDSPNTKLPPLKGITTGSLPLSGLSDGQGAPMRPFPRQAASSSESHLVPALPPPATLSRLGTNDAILPPLSKSPARAQETPSHFGPRIQDTSTSLTRPSIARLDPMSSETRPTRVMSGSMSKGGRYQYYSSMDEFHHSYYAAPGLGAVHRMMDISPAGLGLTSPTHHLSGRPLARYNGTAIQNLRSNTSFDAAKERLHLRGPYQKTRTIIDGITRPANAEKELGSNPVIPIPIHPSR